MMTRNQLAARLHSLALTEIEEGIFSYQGDECLVSYILEDDYFIVVLNVAGSPEWKCYSYAKSSIIDNKPHYVEC